MLAQANRERKDLRAESKRLDRQRVDAKGDVDRLVAAVADTEGKAREALLEALSAAKAEAENVVARVQELDGRMRELEARHLDESHLGRGLEAFDQVWEALLIPERERVLNLLIDRVAYDGLTKQLSITYKPTGIATLATEIAS